MHTRIRRLPVFLCLSVCACLPPELSAVNSAVHRQFHRAEIKSEIVRPHVLWVTVADAGLATQPDSIRAGNAHAVAVTAWQAYGAQRGLDSILVAFDTNGGHASHTSGPIAITITVRTGVYGFATHNLSAESPPR